jgi:hypothetical protein
MGRRQHRDPFAMNVKHLALVGLLGAAGACDGEHARELSVVAELRPLYRLQDVEAADRLALLERPSEGAVYVVAGPDRVGSVRVIAKGELARADGPIDLEPASEVLVDEVSFPELLVVDADGDGDDDVLVRAGPDGEEQAARAGYDPAAEWRERVWLATDLRGPARLVVDTRFDGQLVGLLGERFFWPVGGQGDSMAISWVLTLGARVGSLGETAYVLSREMLHEGIPPCGDLDCLPKLHAGDRSVVGPGLAARTEDTGELALSYWASRSTAHLVFEHYMARTICRVEARDAPCSPVEDWGELADRLGAGAFPPDASVPYVHVAPYLATAINNARVDARLPSGVVVHGTIDVALTSARVAPGAAGSWEVTGEYPGGLAAVEVGEDGARLLGRYAFEGWPGDPWVRPLEIHASRERGLFYLFDGLPPHERVAVVEAPPR